MTVLVADVAELMSQQNITSLWLNKVCSSVGAAAD